MVKLLNTAFAAGAFFVSKAIATEASCNVNGVSVADVVLETGECPFDIPASYQVFADIKSSEDYNVSFFYAVVNGHKYFPDIAAAGREIEIPAIEAYEHTPEIFHVKASETAASNSTAFIKRRMDELNRRDAVADVVAYLETLNGTEVSNLEFTVTLITNSSASASASGPSLTGSATGSVTETVESTTYVTITSCSDNKCSETTVPATPTLTTETVNGETTVYTTYCPVATETVESTTYVTVTSCSDNKCSETTVPATPTLTTETVNGEITVYTTYCPATEAGETTEATTVPTTEAGETTEATTAPTTEAGETTEATTAPTTVVASTSAASSAASSVAAISTYAAAGSVTSPFFLMVLVPLAILF